MTEINPNPTSNPPETEAPKAAPETITVSRVLLNYFVIAAVFFAVGLAVGAITFRQTATATIDQAAIEEAVTSVLIEAGVMTPPADMDVLVDDDPYLGAEDAPIVIVEFSAYACPYCGRHFEQTLEPLIENYGEHVRYVYRDFPSINPNISVPAALAANCALEQDKFWEYHELLFDNQSQLGDAYFVQAAEELELDMDAFTFCLDEQVYMTEINDDFNMGVTMGVSGTPAFFINGEAVSGAQPYSVFERIIQRELDAAGIEY